MGLLFVLDNYDSFTFNLVQYLRQLGETVTVAQHDEVTVADVIALNPERVLLSPGPGRPEEAGIMGVLIDAVAGRVPMLGVCLGHQAIAQRLGGTIGYAPTIMHGKTSEVRHDGSRLYQGVATPFTATRYHSLVVEEATMPSALRVTAWSDDGVVMGVEHREWPLFGMQYHPESILTPAGMRILQNFCEVGT